MSIAAFRLRHETGSSTVILAAAIAMTVIVLLVFAVETLRNEPETFTAIVGILALAVGLDLIWTRLRDGRPTPEG